MELPYDAPAAVDGEPGAHVGLVDDGSHGLVFLGGMDLAEYLHDVADAEEAVGVLEHLGLIGGEIWR